jgi:DNA mismatch repair protein MSH5
VEYVPQVGYLVAVQEAELHLLENSFPELDHLPPASHDDFTDWMGPEYGYSHVVEPLPQEAQLPLGTAFRFVFQQAGVHYFKHSIVEELDGSVGDIKSDIADRQRTLLIQLEDALLDAECTLQQLSTSLSTLDALISLGTLAVEQRLVAPEIVEQPGAILIKAGRHLLQELTVDNFVPNDTFLTAEKNVALISGPNTSGKSVYLKQVALIVYLAHIGSFVPCERARISLVDRIFTRIASTESVSAPHSAFALVLQQVSRMLRSATPRSLCLVDEFGKGTMPVDGIALLAAVVKHFADRGGAGMFVLHFTEILHDAVLTAEVMQKVSCFRMETMLHRSAEVEGTGVNEGEEYCERTPLYVLKNGVATSSEGIPCARSAGVEDAVLRRAAQVKYLVSQRQPIPPVAACSRSLFQNSQHVRLLDLFLRVKDWLGDDGAKRICELKRYLN